MRINPRGCNQQPVLERTNRLAEAPPVNSCTKKGPLGLFGVAKLPRFFMVSLRLSAVLLLLQGLLARVQKIVLEESDLLQRIICLAWRDALKKLAISL